MRLLEQDALFRAGVRKHKVPPLRFAPVGMTELLLLRWDDTVNRFVSVGVTELPLGFGRDDRVVAGGIAQADRGEFIEEEEMDARIERMPNS